MMLCDDATDDAIGDAIGDAKMMLFQMII